MQIINCEQGSPEWFCARAGIPTASMFSTVLASGKGGAESKTRKDYMLKLVGERLTGEPMLSYSNDNMQRGHEMESEARAVYEFLRDAECEVIGFIRSGEKGASPDALVGANGLLEIKTKLPHIQLDLILRGEVPSEHRCQIQGQLWIAEREWCDFFSYWPKLQPFEKRVYRDDVFINTILSPGVDAFNEELNELLDKVK